MTGLAHQQQRSSNGPASARRADGSEIQDRSPTARSSGEPSNGDTEAALEQAGGADGCTDSDDADDYGDDDDDNFDVECIVAEKWDQKSRRMLYLVHWKGFEEKDYTWEPKKHFHAPDTLSDWEALKLHTPAHKRFDWKAWDRRFGIDHENQDGEPSNQEPEDEQSGRSWRNSFSRLSPDQKSTTPIHDDPKIEDPSRNNTCSQIHRSQATAIDVARSPVDQNDAAILLESSVSRHNQSLGLHG
ncbi:hypothetical protein Dda_2944 [Drechslerella dactyloides]|uniref:Chromo domain-containing protein n=1 Tax=Drechslerella dactyloides TaxID=74499 RepID=A0AAD6J0E7_DREDA|nr:hypothetical protein Dda_2944 [Drechslerella dactyloides]